MISNECLFFSLKDLHEHVRKAQLQMTSLTPKLQARSRDLGGGVFVDTSYGNFTRFGFDVTFAF